jgi:hypothetical protein
VCLEANLPVFRGVPDPPEMFLVHALEAMTLGKDGHTKAVLSEEQKMEARQHLSQKFKQNWEANADPNGRMNTFFAIPINHLLAWCLHSEDYALQHGYRAEQFRFIPPPNNEGIPQEPIVLYYLIGDVMFHKLVAEFKRVWMNNVDMRPLTSMAFEFLPQLDRTRYPQIPKDVKTVQGVMSLRSYVTYLVPPKLNRDTIDALAPTLVPGFPSCHQWGLDEIAQQMAIERHLETNVANKKRN